MLLAAGIGGGISAITVTGYTGIPNSADKDADCALDLGSKRMTWTGIGTCRGTTTLSPTAITIIHTFVQVIGNPIIGIATSSATITNALGSDVSGYGYYTDDSGRLFNNNAAIATDAVANAVGDMVTILVDMPALKIYVAVNGTWRFSGNPTLGTGGITIASGTYYAAWGSQGGSGTIISCNQVGGT